MRINSFFRIATVAALFALTACSGGTAATAQSPITTADWEAANPKQTMPLAIFQAQVYEPKDMSKFEKTALVMNGEVLDVGRTDEGGYVIYLSDSASRVRKDYRGGTVAVVIRGKDAEYGRHLLQGRGAWVKYNCNNGKYIGNLEFACVLVVLK